MAPPISSSPSLAKPAGMREPQSASPRFPWPQWSRSMPSLSSRSERTTMLDIDVLRTETPGCAHLAHFNHSGASLPTQATLAAISDHLQREARAGAMEAEASVAQRLDEMRAEAA